MIIAVFGAGRWREGRIGALAGAIIQAAISGALIGRSGRLLEQVIQPGQEHQATEHRGARLPGLVTGREVRLGSRQQPAEQNASALKHADAAEELVSHGCDFFRKINCGF